MPGFTTARLTDAQLKQVIEFIRSLSTPASGAGSVRPTDIAIKGQMSWTGSYAADIQPIFDEFCTRCHGEGLAEAGLRLDSYAGVIKGTNAGAVVTPGMASGSTLVWVIQNLAAPQIRMPHADRPLSPNRIQNIVLWINAGAVEK